VVSNGYTSGCSALSLARPSRFVFFDIQALWRSGLSARVPECQKKYINGGLDQYGTERFGILILPQSEKSVGLKGLEKFSTCCQNDVTRVWKVGLEEFIFLRTHTCT